MRTKHYTDQEFRDLPRYENGDVDYDVLSESFMWMTPKQKDKLSDDDFSRVIDMEEEVNYLLYEFKEEMGYV